MFRFWKPHIHGLECHASSDVNRSKRDQLALKLNLSVEAVVGQHGMSVYVVVANVRQHGLAHIMSSVLLRSAVPVEGIWGPLRLRWTHPSYMKD